MKREKMNIEEEIKSIKDYVEDLEVEIMEIREDIEIIKGDMEDFEDRL